MSKLFFSMLLGVSLRSLFSVILRMEGVGPRRVGVVRCLLVAPGVMMRRRLAMVSGGVRMVLGCLSMVFRCLLRHGAPPWVAHPRWSRVYTHAMTVQGISRRAVCRERRGRQKNPAGQSVASGCHFLAAELPATGQADARRRIGQSTHARRSFPPSPPCGPSAGACGAFRASLGADGRLGPPRGRSLFCLRCLAFALGSGCRGLLLRRGLYSGR